MSEPIKPLISSEDAEAVRRMCANLEYAFREAQPVINAWARQMIEGAEAMAAAFGKAYRPSAEALRAAQATPVHPDNLRRRSSGCNTPL